MTRHPINSCQPMRKTLSPFTLIPIHAHTGCPPIPPEKISKVYNINFVLSELGQIFKWKFRTYHAITIPLVRIFWSIRRIELFSPNGNDQRTKRKEGERRWREEIEIMIKRVLKKGEKQEKKIGEKGWRRWGGWNTRKRFSPRKEKSGAPGWW